MARAAEDRVDRIILHVLEEVPSENPVALHVADLWLDRGSAPEMAFERMAKFPGAADKHAAAFLGHAMSLVALVNKGHGGELAGLPLRLATSQAVFMKWAQSLPTDDA